MLSTVLASVGRVARRRQWLTTPYRPWRPNVSGRCLDSTNIRATGYRSGPDGTSAGSGPLIGRDGQSGPARRSVWSLAQSKQNRLSGPTRCWLVSTSDGTKLILCCQRQTTTATTTTTTTTTLTTINRVASVLKCSPPCVFVTPLPPGLPQNSLQTHCAGHRTLPLSHHPPSFTMELW